MTRLCAAWQGPPFVKAVEDFLEEISEPDGEESGGFSHLQVASETELGGMPPLKCARSQESVGCLLGAKRSDTKI